MVSQEEKIKIIGVEQVQGANYSIMFDRIEAGTYLIAAAATESNLKIQSINPTIIKILEINILKRIGAKIKIS